MRLKMQRDYRRKKYWKKLSSNVNYDTLEIWIIAQRLDRGNLIIENDGVDVLRKAINHRGILLNRLPSAEQKNLLESVKLSSSSIIYHWRNGVTLSCVFSSTLVYTFQIKSIDG